MERDGDEGEEIAKERKSDLEEKNSTLSLPREFSKKKKKLQQKQKQNIAVLAFARETGELHSISSTDARLIALARGLERAAGREASLRARPPPPRAVRRGGPRARPKFPAN